MLRVYLLLEIVQFKPMEKEITDFDGWWKTQHQTIGKVAARAAWDAAWEHRDGEEAREDASCEEAEHFLNSGEEDPQWALPETIPDYRLFTGQIIPLDRG